MKPMLKAPRTKRLKLKYGEPPSNFAFNLNLRLYATEEGAVRAYNLQAERLGRGGVENEHPTVGDSPLVPPRACLST